MKLAFTLLFLTFIFVSRAEITEKLNEVLPPDSTSSLIDRTASLYYLDEGRKAFSNGQIREALNRFREAYVRDQYNARAVYWIAEAHYKLDNFGYVLKYARISESLNKLPDGDLLFLKGKAYHRENKLDSARISFESAIPLLSNSKKKIYDIYHLIDEVNYADSVSKEKLSFKKELLSTQINSGYDDYNFVLSNDGKQAFFVSRRPDTKGGKVNPDDQRFFEDIYELNWNEEENEWGTASNDVERLNSEGFDAVNHLSSDGTEVYLTVNTSVVDVKNPTKGSDICVSKLTREDRWSSPKPIQNKTINTSFFDGAPTLTEDGNTMYFVSDRDGERSKSDIYVVHKVGRNWGTAKKLPMTVNTKGNETTPFITPDGRFLFFSSDGYVGMGDYDIYVTENKDGEWTTPINLGPNFNTVNDDIFFRYYENLNKAVVSTYRIKGSKSSMDIYQLLLEGWQIPVAK